MKVGDMGGEGSWKTSQKVWQHILTVPYLTPFLIQVFGTLAKANNKVDICWKYCSNNSSILDSKVPNRFRLKSIHNKRFVTKRQKKILVTSPTDFVLFICNFVTVYLPSLNYGVGWWLIWWFKQHFEKEITTP